MSQLVWLVTGCSSGFGEVLVRQILARGDRVIATARRPERIGHLEQAGAAVLRLDVTDDQQVLDQTVAEAIAVYGRVDVLVNNAAYITSGAWEDLGYDQFKAIFDTNVFGVIKATRALLPHFRERRSGTLVFISSRSGWLGDPFCSAYSGTKFALEGLVEGLKAEVEPFGIRTFLFEPGRFRTSFLTAGNLQVVPSKIPDYAQRSKDFLEMLAKADRAQPGDPEKGMAVILDFVRGEGCAEGKTLPLRLPLGTDVYEDIKDKCEQTLKLLAEWQSVSKSTDFAV